jgi:ATP-dependent Clp protease ATP-binding subunit ClpC
VVDLSPPGVERLGAAAQQVLHLSVEEARTLRHTWIGTEHLLLGLLRYERIAGPLFGAHPLVDLDAARAEVIKPCPMGHRDVPNGHLPFTPRMMTIFDIIDGHTATLPGCGIEPRHLLYGLLTDGAGTDCRGVAFQVLRTLGADLAELTAQAGA